MKSRFIYFFLIYSQEVLKINKNKIEFVHKSSFDKTVGVNSEVWLNDSKQWLLVYRMNLKDFPNDMQYSCGIYSMLGIFANFLNIRRSLWKQSPKIKICYQRIT